MRLVLVFLLVLVLPACKKKTDGRGEWRSWRRWRRARDAGGEQP